MNFFHSLLKTVIYLITAGVIFVQDCLAQDDPTSIQAHMLFSEGFINANSPDAWSMIKYGDANVNLYTGSIGLSIPVYTYQDEDFTIPISLDYATTGYKPNVQTGILGMGWYLNVGGAITREVRGVYDEERTISLGIYSFDDKWKGSELLGDSDLIPPKVHGYGALYNKTDFSYDDYYIDYAFYGKTGEEYLPMHVHLTDDSYNYYAYETRPDLFHFNFMNYSGTFILQPNGNVIVYNTSHPASEFSVDVTLDEYNGFTSFVITTGDMTKYYFTEIEKAKGFCAESSDQNIHTNNSWKLTKIETPNGRCATFIYGKKYHSYTYVPTKMEEIYDRLMSAKPNGTEDDWIRSNPKQDAPTVNEVETKCLTSIIVDSRATINLSYSDKKRESGIGHYPDVPLKLDHITVYDSNNNVIKTCHCQYKTANHLNETTYNPSTFGITFLDEVAISGEGIYRMQYNDNGFQYPDIDTHSIDWYGYYSNVVTDVNFMPSMAMARQNDNYLTEMRESVFATTKYGVLTEMTYPAGGSSQFEYEQNTFRHDMTGYASSANDHPTAGIRISRIRNYDSDGAEVLCRSFLYMDEDGRSSGQLLWRPIVYSNYSVKAGGYSRINRETLSSSSDFPYSFKTHIEYTRVVEERTIPASDEKSMIEYRYHTSWNRDCRDEIVDYTLEFYMGLFGEIGTFEHTSIENHNSASMARYVSFSQSSMGGKLIEKNIYANDLNHPVEKNLYGYYFYNPATIPFYDAKCMCLGYLMTYRYIFDTPYMNEITKSLYDNTGSLISKSHTTIEIDSMGRTNRTTTTDSKNKTIAESYSYHPEVPSYLTEHIVERDDKVIAANKYNFQTIMSPYDKYYYVPLSQENGIITPETTTADLTYYTGTTYDCYDSEGRPLQITDKSNKKICIVWGYGGLYPIAKIENMTYDVLADQYGAGGTFDGALPTNIETNLRAADNVMVTTYTYKPLVGITSMTDPSGRTTTYEYDNNGKLIHVRDDENESVKSYEYNIVSENQ